MTDTNKNGYFKHKFTIYYSPDEHRGYDWTSEVEYCDLCATQAKQSFSDPRTRHNTPSKREKKQL